MTEATSQYLNLIPRTFEQAQADRIARELKQSIAQMKRLDII